MNSAVIVDCVRTPIGRAHKERGVFRDVRSDDLAAECLKALVARTGIDPAEIEDVILGNTQQSGEQGLNAAHEAQFLVRGANVFEYASDELLGIAGEKLDVGKLRAEVLFAAW